jgi:hypothetical protein
MLYPQSALPSLTAGLFKNPSAEYRGAPFWAWNARLDPAILREQMGYFREMGFGGVHTHPRTGLDTPYLGEGYMDCIKTCLAEAKAAGMFLYLYDEDRWPSGSAGGLVTREKRFRRRHLLFTAEPYEVKGDPTGTAPSYVKPVRTANGELLGVYDVVLGEDGSLARYRRIPGGEAAEGKKWYAYLESDLPDSWYNNQTYIDTLNPEAVKRFVEITHDAYRAAVGGDFGGAVPSIFTDEPMFSYQTCLPFPGSGEDAAIAWTGGFAGSYRDAYDEDILEKLPELFWELPENRVSPVRYRYHNHVTDLFVHAFADTVGAWCGGNNLLLTGHLMREPTLRSQTTAVGEAMRSYRSFGLPGVDMLCNHYEYTTVKQAQSAARQYGREGVLSELYGVTSWSYDFRGHKLQGDWQAALGVTNRVPHLAFYSMAGEAKRDYPASIHYQSPWFREYPLIEDHFARINTALTRGKPLVRAALIHPIESFWLHWGPGSTTLPIREQLEQRFSSVTQWLLFGGIDFDYISEALLPELCGEGHNPLRVGKMRYDAVIVPACETLRASTLERLEAFRDEGGRLIFMGEAPALTEALRDPRGALLAERSIRVPFEKASLMEALRPVRALTLYLQNGEMASRYLYQLREDNDCRWLFIAQGKAPEERDVCVPEPVRIVLEGSFSVEEYRTLSGEARTLPAVVRDGTTCIEYVFYPHDGLLLRLQSCGESAGASAPASPALRRNPEVREGAFFPPALGISLAEPNALLLDRADFALDGEAWLPAEEILRLDNALRERLGMPPRQGEVAQPWTLPKNPAARRVRLRFTVESETALDSVTLAGEGLEDSTLIWNGKQVNAPLTGYYVDRAIGTLVLGRLEKGLNVLEIAQPFGEHTNLEWYYLLGDFGVRVKGRTAVVTGPVRELSFGDITRQGLPFYGGNLSYRLPLPPEFINKNISLRIPHYRGALLAVYAGGERRGTIAFAPYELDFRAPASGLAEIVLYGSRVNTFGAVHMAGDQERRLSPRSWRTEGDSWSDEYVLEPAGILSAPRCALSSAPLCPP